MERGKLETLANEFNNKYHDENKRMRRMIFEELKKGFELYRHELLAQL